MFRQLSRYNITWYCAIALIIFSSGSQVTAASPTLPFHTGEELTFKVSWLGIGVGTATMKITPHLNPTNPGKPLPEVWRLISPARTYRS